jgi:hypothetical protein
VTAQPPPRVAQQPGEQRDRTDPLVGDVVRQPLLNGVADRDEQGGCASPPIVEGLSMLAGWPGVNPRLMGGRRPQGRFLGELVIAVRD